MPDQSLKKLQNLEKKITFKIVFFFTKMALLLKIDNYFEDNTLFENATIPFPKKN